MNRITPKTKLQNETSCFTAVCCAIGHENIDNTLEFFAPKGKNYVTLDEANRFIRKNLNVKRNIRYRRDERPILKDLHLDGRAIVCTTDRYLYLEHENYYAFSDEDENKVVSVWQLE